MWYCPTFVNLVSSAMRPETCSCEDCGSKSDLETRMVRFVCIRVELVEPVEDSVVTRRRAEARRRSFGLIKL